MSGSSAHPSQVVIEKEKRIWAEGPFSLNKATLRYQKFDGNLSGIIKRFNFERGDSASILLLNEKSDSVCMVKQFRYPVYAGISKYTKFVSADAWLIEIVAGIVDKGMSNVEVAKKELLEESGFRLAATPKHLVSVFSSPGGSSEMIHIYMGYVSKEEKESMGGGVASEGEDISVLELKISEALDMVRSGRICDAKTVIALQCLALRRSSKP